MERRLSDSFEKVLAAYEKKDVTGSYAWFEKMTDQVISRHKRELYATIGDFLEKYQDKGTFHAEAVIDRYLALLNFFGEIVIHVRAHHQQEGTEYTIQTALDVYKALMDGDLNYLYDHKYYAIIGGGITTGVICIYTKDLMLLRPDNKPSPRKPPTIRIVKP